MSYRCVLCRSTSTPGQPMLKHIIHRTNAKGHQEIERELAVCGSCKWAIQEGVPLYRLVRAEPRTNGGQNEDPPTFRRRQAGKPSHLSVPGNIPRYTPKVRTSEETEEENDGVRCEVCNELIGDEGQITAEGVLCSRHLPRRAKS